MVQIVFCEQYSLKSVNGTVHSGDTNGTVHGYNKWGTKCDYNKWYTMRGSDKCGTVIWILSCVFLVYMVQSVSVKIPLVSWTYWY